MKQIWVLSFIILISTSCGGAGRSNLSPIETDIPLPTATQAEEILITETVMVEPTEVLATETEPAPPTTIPQATAPEETPTQIAPAQPAAIIARTEDGPNSFYMVGGSQNGHWLSGEDMAAFLAANQAYNLYSAFGFEGEQQAESLVFEPICDDHFVSFNPLTNPQSVVGVTGDWPVLPRTPQTLPTDTEVYLKAVADWLIEQAPSQPIVVIDKIWRVDIEGDGTDEVFISATRFAEPSGHNVEPRDYSVVLMRTVIGNEVVTVELVGDYYAEVVENQFPLTYSLDFIGDLNADGRLEVVVGVSRWEGSGAIVFEINRAEVQKIFSVGCSL